MSSSSFYFDYDGYTASATETNTYTVFGETVQEETGVEQVITVNVPLATMKDMFKVTDGWADDVVARIKDGQQVYPTLALDISAASTQISPHNSSLVSFDPAVDRPTFTDDASQTRKSLQWYLHAPVDEEQLTSADSSKDWLLEIPSIAIKKVQVSQTPASDLTAIIPKVTVDHALAADDALVGPATEKGAIRGLFEQLVNANKVNANNGALDLAVGDSMSFYVSYSLDKSYTFKIDTDLSTGNAALASASFTMGGVSHTLESSVAGLTSSASATKKMEWKFVATA